MRKFLFSVLSLICRRVEERREEKRREGEGKRREIMK